MIEMRTPRVPLWWVDVLVVVAVAFTSVAQPHISASPTAERARVAAAFTVSALLLVRRRFPMAVAVCTAVAFLLMGYSGRLSSRCSSCPSSGPGGTSPDSWR